MPSSPKRPRTTVVEPYRVTLAYRYADLSKARAEGVKCPRSVLVHGRDVEDAITQARLLVPHAWGITSVNRSTSNAEAAL